MLVRPLEAKDVPLAASWLALEANHRWLDFGGGQQILTARTLTLMRQRAIHDLRVFTADEDESPIGIVAVSDINRAFRTGTLWYVLGEKRFAGRGYTTRAVHAMLDTAFGTIGLRAVQAWAVATNKASMRVLEKSRFRPVGTLRACHEVDGRVVDRVLYDLLAAEHNGRG